MWQTDTDVTLYYFFVKTLLTLHRAWIDTTNKKTPLFSDLRSKNYFI